MIRIATFCALILQPRSRSRKCSNVTVPSPDFSTILRTLKLSTTEDTEDRRLERTLRTGFFLRVPCVYQQWSAGAQRQLSTYMVVSADYVGTKGANIWTLRNLNQPDPVTKVLEDTKHMEHEKEQVFSVSCFRAFVVAFQSPRHS